MKGSHLNMMMFNLALMPSAGGLKFDFVVAKKLVGILMRFLKKHRRRFCPDPILLLLFSAPRFFGIFVGRVRCLDVSLACGFRDFCSNIGRRRSFFARQDVTALQRHSNFGNMLGSAPGEYQCLSADSLGISH